MKYLTLAFVVSFVWAQKHFPLPDYQYLPDQDTGFSRYYYNELRNSRSLILTFDDGPHRRNTAEILDILKEYQIKGIFFILTKNIKTSNLPILNRILREGHWLGSHGEEHDNTNRLTQEEFETMLENSVLKIEKLIQENVDLGYQIDQYQNGVYYRFPYGAYGRSDDYHQLNSIRSISTKLYQKACLNFMFWDVDSSDWIIESRDQYDEFTLVENLWGLLEGGASYAPSRDDNGRWILRPRHNCYPIGGGVVLFHDIHDVTVHGLRMFLQENEVRENPYQFVDPYNREHLLSNTRHCPLAKLPL